MKIICLLGTLFLLFSCAGKTATKPSEKALSKPRWQNVDSELRSGARKAKGLLERAGIVGSENAEATSGNNPTTKTENEDSKESGMLQNIQDGANKGWNKVLGFFDGLFDGDEKTQAE